MMLILALLMFYFRWRYSSISLVWSVHVLIRVNDFNNRNKIPTNCVNIVNKDKKNILFQKNSKQLLPHYKIIGGNIDIMRQTVCLVCAFLRVLDTLENFSASFTRVINFCFPICFSTPKVLSDK